MTYMCDYREIGEIDVSCGIFEEIARNVVLVLVWNLREESS